MSGSNENASALIGGAIIVGFVLAIIAAFAFGLPLYWVWSAEQGGRAAFARAEQEKKIQVEQARAEVESAKLRAEAIEIIGQKLKEYPEYRDQEFIGQFGDALNQGNIQQIIYVPTEANIPIVRTQ